MAETHMLPAKERPDLPCLPRGGSVPCNKEGGVCSLRLYRESSDSGEVSVSPGVQGRLVVTCPQRFAEGGVIYQWIGNEILGHPEPLIVGEVGFLEREASPLAEPEVNLAREDVGRIDNVLVHPMRDPMLWCALEIQAVYFSGPAMLHEFRAILAHGDSLPFPVRMRRPDFRSSGPKRLMPQLQIKVPTLRRWGKKMAVVVDESFFDALGHMDSVKDVSNADIAWFVVRFAESAKGAKLEQAFVHLTTLERAVEGLTAGRPVSLETFEARIRAKLGRASAGPPSSPDCG